MEERNPTQLLIVDTYKELVYSKDFNKITVKMIAAKAGIIRSTFYNYFQDKYAVLDWIIRTEITDNVSLLIEKKMYLEALKLLFSCINEDQVFFSKAFKITGQNGFEEILLREFMKMFLGVYRYSHFSQTNRVITKNNIAHYQSHALILYIKMWLCENRYGDATVDEIFDAYTFMLMKGNSMIISDDPLLEKLSQSLPAPLNKLPLIIGKIRGK